MLRCLWLLAALALLAPPARAQDKGPAGTWKVTLPLQPVSTKPLWLLKFEAADNAATFSVNASPAIRPRTTAFAKVSDDVRRTNGTRYALGSNTALAAALQEVVNRPGWKSGNSVALIAYGPATNSWSRLGFYTFDGGASRTPRLEVTYRVPGPSASPSASVAETRMLT